MRRSTIGNGDRPAQVDLRPDGRAACWRSRVTWSWGSRGSPVREGCVDEAAPRPGVAVSIPALGHARHLPSRSIGGVLPGAARRGSGIDVENRAMPPSPIAMVAPAIPSSWKICSRPFDHSPPPLLIMPGPPCGGCAPDSEDHHDAPFRLCLGAPLMPAFRRPVSGEKLPRTRIIIALSRRRGAARIVMLRRPQRSR